MKTLLQLTTIFCTLGWLSGCANAGNPGHVTFNPEAVYRVPADGLVVEGLIDADTGKIQGKMYVPPGTFVFYDGEEIEQVNPFLPATKRKRAKLLREAMLRTTINGLEKLTALEQGKLALLIMKAIENSKSRQATLNNLLRIQKRG